MEKYLWNLYPIVFNFSQSDFTDKITGKGFLSNFSENVD